MVQHHVDGWFNVVVRHVVRCQGLFLKLSGKGETGRLLGALWLFVDMWRPKDIVQPPRSCSCV
jgi:hypothetical protein